jgi:hypothetical protein
MTMANLLAWQYAVGLLPGNWMTAQFARLPDYARTEQEMLALCFTEQVPESQRRWGTGKSLHTFWNLSLEHL